MHYLDNAATTRPLRAAVQEALSCAQEDWGNPSSLHAMGRAARLRLETARAQVGASLSAPPEEVFFTASGTESVNWAIRGAAMARRRRGNHIVTTALEHPAVHRTIDALTQEGFLAATVPLSGGTVRAEDVIQAVRPETILVSMALVAGETGHCLPVAEVAARLRALNPNILLHTDAVQGYLKTECSPSALGVDLLSISAHKIGGFKGAGALWARPGLRFLPLIHGGEQEHGQRAGTQAMPALCAFGAAAKARFETWRNDAANMAALRDELAERLARTEEAVLLPGREAPHIVAFSLPGYPSEVLLRFLSDRGVYLSSGAACHQGKKSQALLALGLPGPVADSVLRVSLCPDNTKDDLDALMTGLHTAARELVKKRQRL